MSTYEADGDHSTAPIGAIVRRLDAADDRLKRQQPSVAPAVAADVLPKPTRTMEVTQ